MTDPRIVVGAGCSWWGSIREVKTNHGLPCCPHCGSVLYEFDSIEAWDASVANYVARSGDAEYSAVLAWGRGKCFPSFNEARRAFRAEQAGG